MTLKLHSHPLASYCWKDLIALYEGGAPFETALVDLGDPEARAAFLRLSPMGKMPALVDDDRTVLETSVIIEYLDRYRPGAPLVPSGDEGLEARFWDRFFDLYVQEPMQKIVGDRLRPQGGQDPVGVEQARASLQTAYGVIEARMAGRTWAAGEAFTIADCAAAPGLFYADLVQPIGAAWPATAAYLQRLRDRPSVSRVLDEAQPYFHMFPR